MFVDQAKRAPQDWEAIVTYLESNGLQVDRRAGFRQFAAGSANLNYLLRLGNGRKVVLRRPPDGPLPPGAHDVAREYKIYSRLGRRLPYVPLGLAFCDDASVIGVPFIVFEFREGLSIGRELPRRLAHIEGIGDKLSRLIVESLAKLHKVDPQEAGLLDLGKGEGFVARQVRGWHKRAGMVLAEEPMRKVARIHDWLAANVPARQPIALVHHDYKLDNMLIDPDTLTINGVIDWEMATIGNPVFDLALTLTCWGGQPEGHPYAGVCRMPCEAPGWWTWRRVLETYLETSGLDLSEDELRFYWMLALLRTVVVYAQLQVLYAREKGLQDKLTPGFCIPADKLPSVVGNVLDHAVRLVGAKLDW